MRQSVFLYGSSFDATQLRELTAEQYLWRKIHASQELIEQLYAQPIVSTFFCLDRMCIVTEGVRDMFRINESGFSQRHNRKLIDELYGRDTK